jgi:ribosome biogenesis GTPase A
MDNRKATFLRGMAELAGSGKATDGLRGLLGADAVEKLEKLVSRERATNPPRVVVIGKAGVGKSTTINNLFSARLRISHAVQVARIPRTASALLDWLADVVDMASAMWSRLKQFTADIWRDLRRIFL